MRSKGPLVLAFDTSAAQCAAAVVLDGTACTAIVETMARGQAERLMPMLEEVLRNADAAWRDVTAIGVCTGPGNFTGLRLSVAAARGLALSLRVPAVGVSRFEALAHGMQGEGLVTISAPQKRFYAQRVRNGVGIAPPEIADAVDLEAPSGGWSVGDLPLEHARRLGLAPRGMGSVPDPSFVAFRAEARLAARAINPYERPVPQYLREANARPSTDLPPLILDRDA